MSQLPLPRVESECFDKQQVPVLDGKIDASKTSDGGDGQYVHALILPKQEFSDVSIFLSRIIPLLCFACIGKIITSAWGRKQMKHKYSFVKRAWRFSFFLMCHIVGRVVVPL